MRFSSIRSGENSNTGRKNIKVERAGEIEVEKAEIEVGKAERAEGKADITIKSIDI